LSNGPAKIRDVGVRKRKKAGQQPLGVKRAKGVEGNRR